MRAYLIAPSLLFAGMSHAQAGVPASINLESSADSLMETLEMAICGYLFSA